VSYNYEHLQVSVQGRMATVVIDNPPINLITPALFLELDTLSQELSADDGLTVVVLKSADPDFFLAHFDVSAILTFPTDTPAEREAELNAYHQMCERFRTMDKITIAQIEGRVGGGGSELAASCDMRFGVAGKTRINQMEVPIGILPGGTGTQRLPRLMGRARALEVIIGAEDLDAETAERWGYLNRIFAADEIEGFVDRLAKRIASFPVAAVRLAKRSVDAGDGDLEAGMREEAYLFQELLRTDDAPVYMQRFLDMGGQTRAGELEVAELSGRVAASQADKN
jgi:enoyl-CoA hydratase/carnithine racemase